MADVRTCHSSKEAAAAEVVLPDRLKEPAPGVVPGRGKQCRKGLYLS